MPESSVSPVSGSADKRSKDVIEVVSKLPGLPTILEDMELYTLPNGTSKVGTVGNGTKLISNYLHLSIQAESRKLNVYEYALTFEPELESGQTQRLFLLSGQFENVIGRNWIFKSTIPQKLFLNFKLSDEEVVLVGKHSRMPELSHQMKLELIERDEDQEKQQMTQFCDALFIRLYEILGMVELNAKLYDPQGAVLEPGRRFEIWPGLLTYTRYYDGGLMLGFDTTIRVTKTSNCYDILQRMSKDGEDDLKRKFTKYALEKLFMTKFDARIYKVEDIDWTQNPTSLTTLCGRTVTYAEYYKLNYNVEIQHMEQPLFVVIGRSRNRNFHGPKEERKLFFDRIAPELCYPMRLEETREDKVVIPSYLFRCSKLPPMKNVNLIEAYANKIQQNEDCISLLKFWNLELGDFVQAEGRVLESPKLHFGSRIRNQLCSAKTVSGSSYHQIPLKKWFIFCSHKDQDRTEFLVETYLKTCTRMGINIEPNIEFIKIAPATIPDFHRVVRDTIAQHKDTQFVMVIIPAGLHRQEFYASLKKLLILDLKGLPSQFIRASTLYSKKTIVEMMDSLTIQINCKLGGSQRALHLPELRECLMFVGIDSFHSRNKNCASVFAMVASLNQTCTKFYSRAVVQKVNQETGDQILPLFSLALAAYYDENGKWPDRVIVFRDGINNRNMELVKDYELGQMRGAVHFLSPNLPKFTFIIAQKRIIERLYNLQDNDSIGNPLLGTVLDNTLTRINFVDFFLVSQVRSQCTVPPVHYVVIANDGDYPVDTIQKLTHASCFMYFNCPGSIRIPGICQYAHRLANLVGSHLKQEPIEASTQKQLYYL